MSPASRRRLKRKIPRASSPWDFVREFATRDFACIFRSAVYLWKVSCSALRNIPPKAVCAYRLRYLAKRADDICLICKAEQNNKSKSRAAIPDRRITRIKFDVCIFGAVRFATGRQTRKMKKTLRLGVLFWCIPLAVYCLARRRNFPDIKGGTFIAYCTTSGKQVRESAIRRTTRRITQDTAKGGMRTHAYGKCYLNKPNSKF